MITMYATTQDGQGYCERIGDYPDISEISIRIGMFADDVVISFEKEEKEYEPWIDKNSGKVITHLPKPNEGEKVIKA